MWTVQRRYIYKVCSSENVAFYIFGTDLQFACFFSSIQKSKTVILYYYVLI